MNKFFNRPLSPHLSIYVPQISSLFSIWHRITAVYIFSYFTFFLFLSKVTLNFFFINLFSLSPFHYISLICNYLLFISLYYHFLNGVRHILWDVNLFLTHLKLTSTSNFIFLLLLISQILFFKNYLF